MNRGGSFEDSWETCRAVASVSHMRCCIPETLVQVRACLLTAVSQELNGQITAETVNLTAQCSLAGLSESPLLTALRRPDLRVSRAEILFRSPCPHSRCFPDDFPDSLHCALADQASALVAQPGPVNTASLEMFRHCTRRHVLAGLKLVRQRRDLLEAARSSVEMDKIWNELQRDCQALFLTEMLGRLWGGILEARSQSEGADSILRNLARYVLLQHLELRREILHLMNRWLYRGLPAGRGTRFPYRRMERWTDVLLGPLVVRYSLEDYVFDVNRSREYSPEYGTSRRNQESVAGRLPRKLSDRRFFDLLSRTVGGPSTSAGPSGGDDPEHSGNASGRSAVRRTSLFAGASVGRAGVDPLAHGGGVNNIAGA